MKTTKTDIPPTKAKITGKPSLQEQGIIIDKDTARCFFQTNLRPFFSPTINEKQKAAMKAEVTIKDLMYIRSFLLSSSVSGKPTKQKLLHEIRSFFDSETRVRDLTKNLRFR